MHDTRVYEKEKRKPETPEMPLPSLMLTRNHLIAATLASGLLGFAALGTALYAPDSLRKWWSDEVNAPGPFNDEVALYETAEMHLRGNDDWLARDVAKRLLDVSPRSARGHKLMAALNFKDGNFHEALSEAQIASQLNPRDPVSQLGVAQAQQKLGYNRDAIHTYEKLMKSNGLPEELRLKAVDDLADLKARLTSRGKTPSPQPTE